MPRNKLSNEYMYLTMEQRIERLEEDRKKLRIENEKLRIENEMLKSAIKNVKVIVWYEQKTQKN